ncbi:hypothetical protein AB0C33_38665 [Nonomuraea sp. NPDC048881]|uniref:hypothetical protein n=1 Tax=Nonomuraea sp. NPDC048881 TaxID=3155030 RepID=UPI0033E0B9F3
MSQLVQRVRFAGQVVGGGLEEFGGAPVGQPGLAGGGVEAARRQFGADAAAGQEQRAGAAAVQEAGQQAGVGGAPDDDVDGAALAPDPGAAVAQALIARPTASAGRDVAVHRSDVLVWLFRPGRTPG